LTSELNTGTPVKYSAEKLSRQFCFLNVFALELGTRTDEQTDGRTDGRTDKTRNAAYLTAA